MPRQASQFIQDFLFTDSNNHIEFLKWIQILDKDDYMLLVYLLERLCPVNHVKHRPTVPFHPHFDPHRIKNPLNVAKAYVALLHLSKHEFNIFEVAYLDPNLSSLYTAFAALISQWLLVLILLLYHVVKEHTVPDPYSDLENFILVALVCAVSSFIFAKKSVKQWSNCSEFIEIFSEMGKPAPVTFLLNRLANQLLSIVVLFFNVYFVMISPDPSEAILNALALFFIVEIDDELVPDWDDEYTDDVKANGFSGYLQHPLPSEALYVTIRTQGVDYSHSKQEPNKKKKKLPDPTQIYVEESSESDHSDSDGHVDRAEDAADVELHHGPGMYTDDDKLYVDVVQEQRRVSVWIGMVDSYAHLTTEHIRIDYYLHGDHDIVDEFLDALAHFKCIRGFKDIMDLVDPLGSYNQIKKPDPSSENIDPEAGPASATNSNEDKSEAQVRRRMIPGGSHFEQTAKPFKLEEYKEKAALLARNKMRNQSKKKKK